MKATNRGDTITFQSRPCDVEFTGEVVEKDEQYLKIDCGAGVVTVLSIGDEVYDFRIEGAENAQ
mgnify:CR=1 FL=1